MKTKNLSLAFVVGQCALSALLISSILLGCSSDACSDIDRLFARAMEGDESARSELSQVVRRLGTSGAICIIKRIDQDLSVDNAFRFQLLKESGDSSIFDKIILLRETEGEKYNRVVVMGLYSLSNHLWLDTALARPDIRTLKIFAASITDVTPLLPGFEKSHGPSNVSEMAMVGFSQLLDYKIVPDRLRQYGEFRQGSVEQRAWLTQTQSEITHWLSENGSRLVWVDSLTHFGLAQHD